MPVTAVCYRAEDGARRIVNRLIRPYSKGGIMEGQETSCVRRIQRSPPRNRLRK